MDEDFDRALELGLALVWPVVDTVLIASWMDALIPLVPHAEWALARYRARACA